MHLTIGDIITYGCHMAVPPSQLSLPQAKDRWGRSEAARWGLPPASACKSDQA
jgi:hypothetical protein